MRYLEKQKDLAILAAAILILNVPLLFGQTDRSMIFLADRFWDGQWYRFFTAPFVHVSLYHLALDGLAFVMLYAWLPCGSAGRRLASLAGIHTAVMLAVMLCAKQTELGYCGLSGAAHGLMGLWCLEMMRNPQRSMRQAGWIGFGITAGKCLIEALSGQAVLAGWHLGNVGTPVVSSHWGGLLGGIAVFAMMNLKWAARPAGFGDQSQNAAG